MSPNSPMDAMCEEQIKDICNKLKAQYFYMVWKLHTSTRLCLEARISTDLIQGYN